MTVQRYTVPHSSYASTKYTATVAGSAAGVFGVSHAFNIPRMGKTRTDTLEVSFFTFGADVDAVVRITPTSGLITDAVVYPKSLAAEVVIDDTGAFCDITVPQGARLYVEFNDDVAYPLMIFSDELAIPGTELDVTYSDGVTVAAVTGETLRFPAGVHDIGDLFPVQDSARIVIEGGAWVIGSFDLRGSDSVDISGHGCLSGGWKTATEITHTEADFAANFNAYTLILGTNADGTSQSTGGTLSGITLVDYPFYAVGGGISYVEGAKFIAPWYWECGGPVQYGDPANAGAYGNRSWVKDSFCYTADDTMVDPNSVGETDFTNNLIVLVSSGFVFTYTTAGANGAGRTNITNCTVVPRSPQPGVDVIGLPDWAPSIVKVWHDESTANASFNRTGIRINGLFVEGEGTHSPLFSFEQKLYPYGTSYAAAGDISDLYMSNVTMETAPTLRARLWGRDYDNTPYNLRFSAITIGGVTLTGANWDTYVVMNAYPYDIQLGTTVIRGARPVLDPGFDPGVEVPGVEVEVEEDPGTGEPTSNSYCDLDFADDYHEAYGNPTAWSTAAVGAKSAALIQATEEIDLRYADRWYGYQYSSTQALAWPRYGVLDRAGEMILQDTIPEAVKRACAVGALLIVQGESLVSQTRTTADISSESRTIGPLSTSKTYRGGKPAETQFPKLDAILNAAGLIAPNGGWGASVV